MTQLAIIIGYLVLLLACGLLANRISRGTARDYMLASHSIGPVLLLLSLFGTTMTAFALVGSTGKSFQLGVGVYALMASSSGIIHSLCFFLVGIKLWSLGRQHGYTTQTQYFRDRLESRAFGFLLFPILVALVIPYLLIGILGGGAVIEGVTLGIFPDTPDEGLPAWIGSLMICSVVLVYVFLGGMRGTAWANAFQTTVFMVLGVITFLVIARQLGGGHRCGPAVAPGEARHGASCFYQPLLPELPPDPALGRHVPSSFPALADRPQCREFQVTHYCPPHFHNYCLGSLRAGRCLGNVSSLPWRAADPRRH